MADEEQIKLAHAVLLQESQQLHDNIQRNLGDMQRLVGLAFPILTGVFALALEGKIGGKSDPALLYPLFSILFSFLVVSFNNIWMQLLTFTRYKYAVALPELYKISGRSGDNYGQFTVRGGLVRTMIGAAIVQAILLPVAAATAYQVAYHYADALFAIPAYIALLFATATTVGSWIAAKGGVEEIQKSLDVTRSVGNQNAL